MLKKFLKKQVEQSAELSILKGIVISNTKSQCHPELVSGSQKLRRFRNKFGMTINKISPSPLPLSHKGRGNKAPSSKSQISVLPQGVDILFGRVTRGEGIVSCIKGMSLRVKASLTMTCLFCLTIAFVGTCVTLKY